MTYTLSTCPYCSRKLARILTLKKKRNDQ
jgi:hypothetical protein